MTNIPSINNYNTNARSAEDIHPRSTKIKYTSKEYNLNNGRVFDKNFNKQLLNNDPLIKTKNLERKNFFSWVIDTLNPLNHIPVINTINKLDRDNSNSLDMFQSAIGGIIYGGGVTGIAKGLGGWFAGKLFPKNIKITENKLENNTSPILINNGKIKNVINSKQLKRVDLKEANIQTETSKIKKIDKNIIYNENKIDVIDIKKNKSNYFYFYKEGKEINKNIDTKA